MALLPKIGKGTLVAPEQILLMHTPKRPKRRQKAFDNNNNLDDDDEPVLRKIRGPAGNWWKDPSDVAIKVKKKTKRRQKAIHVSENNSATNGIERHKRLGRTSTRIELDLNVYDDSTLNTERGHDDGDTQTTNQIQDHANRFEDVNGETVESTNCKDKDIGGYYATGNKDTDKQKSTEFRDTVRNQSTKYKNMDRQKSSNFKDMDSHYTNGYTETVQQNVGHSNAERHRNNEYIERDMQDATDDKYAAKQHTTGYIDTDRHVRFKETLKDNNAEEHVKKFYQLQTLKRHSSDKAAHNSFPSGNLHKSRQSGLSRPESTPNSFPTGNVQKSRTRPPPRPIKNAWRRVDNSPRSPSGVKTQPLAQSDTRIAEDQVRLEDVEAGGSEEVALLPAARRSVQARVRAARERARIWAETCSDPGDSNTHGNNNKAIHNDAVLKGRPNVPRRGQTFNELARPKHGTGETVADKQENKQKPAAAASTATTERGKRLPPAKKEVQVSGPDQRTVSSAPAKEQPGTKIDSPMMNGPVPKVNTMVPRNDMLEKSGPTPAGQQPRQDKSTPRTNVEEKPTPRAEKTTTERPKPALEPPKVTPRPEMVKPKPEKSFKKVEDPSEPGTGTGRSDEEGAAEKRHRTHPRLPPDDHGPVNPPRPKLVSPPPPRQPKKEENEKEDEEDEDFRYYASRKLPGTTQGQASPRVPPLNIPSEKNEKPTPTQRNNKATDSKRKSRSRSNSPIKTPRSKTLELSKSPAGEEPVKKRREVTIIDTRDVPPSIREPFLDEFKYGIHGRPKAFDEMDDEEKVDYFRNTLKMKPDQIRELTFHPKVNEKKVIHNTYTGVDAKNWTAPTSARGKSAKRPKAIATKVYRKVQTVEPYKRKSFMLSRLQGVIYRHINSVYGNTPKTNREKQFFQKLAQVQMNEYQKRYDQLADNERKWLESTYRQKQQLKNVRKKFEDDAWRRFMTQYVTSKVLEAEYKDREDFGLPNDLNELTSRSPARRMPMTLTPKSRTRVNQKRYGNMFNYSMGPEQRKQEGLKFEGFDTVYVDTKDDQGKPTKQRRTVEDIMKEAKKILNQSDDSDIDDTPPPPTGKKKPKRPARHYNERKPGSERYERPQAHRSRDWRHSDAGSEPPHRSKSRSKSRTRAAPKTMKELVNRRNKEAAPVNRYKASNFESIKKNLLKDSATLDKTVKDKAPKRKQTHKDAIEQVAQSNDPVVIQRRQEQSDETLVRDDAPDPEHDQTNDEPVPDSKPAVVTTVTTSTTETTTERVLHNGTDGTVSKASFATGKGTTDYLDHTETQMGIDTAREQHVTPANRHKGGSKRTSAQTKPSDSETLNEEVASITSKMTQNKDTISNKTQSRRESQVPRTQSRASVVNKKPGDIYKSDGKLSRAPSMTSIQSKQTQNAMNTDTQAARAPSRAPSRPPSRFSVYGKYENTAATRRNSVTSQQNGNNRPSQNGRVSRTSVVKPAPAKEEPQNGTGELSETSNANEHGSATSYNTNDQTKPSYIKDGLMNGGINGDTNDKSATISQDTQKEPTKSSPVVNGHPNSRSSSLNRGSNTPVVKKSVRTSKDSSNASPVINGYSKSPRNSFTSERNKPIVKKNVQVSDVVNEVVLTKSTNNRTGKPVTKTKKQKQERPKASKRVVRARSPAGRKGDHTDARVAMDDYERRSESRPARTRKRSGSRGRGRSGSGTRKRSVSRSRERKRAVSRDRKTSYSRFPDIDKSGRHSRLSNDGRGGRRSVNVRMREEATERELTPKKEQKPWKDLVQKYLRQPSPKVGRTEDRSLLEATLSTDEEDDEIDIFERAKKRYLLDSDEESI